jgi:hypothetical protein
MKTSKSSTYKLAKSLIPVGLMISIQQATGVEAAQVDTQAHIQEVASLVQQAMQQAGESVGTQSELATLSESEINSQIHSTIEEAIKQQ